jgi:hypothetical protein
MKLRNFTGTSDAPYDKHRYAIVSNQGERIIVDDYMEVYQIWMQSDELSHVEVLDRIEKKKPVKGFGG